MTVYLEAVDRSDGFSKRSCNERHIASPPSVLFGYVEPI